MPPRERARRPPSAARASPDPLIRLQVFLNVPYAALRAPVPRGDRRAPAAKGRDAAHGARAPGPAGRELDRVLSADPPVPVLDPRPEQRPAGQGRPPVQHAVRARPRRRDPCPRHATIGRHPRGVPVSASALLERSRVLRSSDPRWTAASDAPDHRRHVLASARSARIPLRRGCSAPARDGKPPPSERRVPAACTRRGGSAASVYAADVRLRLSSGRARSSRRGGRRRHARRAGERAPHALGGAAALREAHAGPGARARWPRRGLPGSG